MTADAEILRKTFLFSEVSDDTLERLAARASRERFHAGDVIFQEGQHGHALYVVIDGEVRISIKSPTREDITLALLVADDLFGEMSLFDDDDTRSATATARIDTEVLILKDADFQDAVEHDMVAFRAFLKALSTIVRRMNERLKDVAMLSPAGRVAKMLLALLGRHGYDHPEGMAIANDLSLEDLAGLCVMYRTEILRVMEPWQLQGVIGRDPDSRHWIVRRRDVLENAAGQ